MRIWILTTELPGPLCGGIAQYVHAMASALVAKGDSICVIASGETFQDAKTAEGYRTVTFPTRLDVEFDTSDEKGEPDAHPRWPYNVLDQDFGRAFEFANFLNEFARSEGPPDLIEAPEYKALACFVKQRQLLEPGYLPGVPLVLGLHTPEFVVRRFNQEPQYTLPQYWVGEQEKATMVASDQLIAPSQFIADQMREMLNEPDLSVEICHNPFWPPVGVSDSVEVDYDPGEILFYGRLEARKGVLQLLDAAEKMWRAGDEFRLTLMGPSIGFPPKGRDMATYLIERYRRRVEEGRLLVIPGLARGLALERLRSAGAIVIPSLWENFPYTCLEAMYLRKVVVASGNGGMSEVLGTDSQAGFVFRGSDCEDLISTLRHVLELSDTERRTIGMAARSRVLKICDPGQIAERRQQIYKNVVARKNDSDIFPFFNRRFRESKNSLAAPFADETPLVSVVVPFYNLGEYVAEAVDSILASDYPNFDLTVIDDGSDEEDSLEALAELEKRREPRLRIVSQENVGLANTRNRGALEAKGEIVVFVDADDRVEPGFIRRAVWTLKKYRNIHVVASWIRYFGDNRGAWFSWNWQLPYLLIHNQMIPICAVRKDSFLAFGRNCPDMSYGLEDFESWISMAENGCGGVALPDFLTCYRIRGRSMFQLINRAQQMYLYRVIVERHPDFYREYGPETFQLLTANGPAHDFDQPTSWAAPYDIIAERFLVPLKEERDRTAEQWRETVRLRAEHYKALVEAEKQWKMGCDLRERLADLDRRCVELEMENQRLRQDASEWQAPDREHQP